MNATATIATAKMAAAITMETFLFMEAPSEAWGGPLARPTARPGPTYKPARHALSPARRGPGPTPGLRARRTPGGQPLEGLHAL